MRPIFLGALLVFSVAGAVADAATGDNVGATPADPASADEKADADIVAAVKAWERDQQQKAAEEKKEAGTLGVESTGPKIGSEGGGVEPMDGTLRSTDTTQSKQP